jgi:hypothetical protein
LDSMRRDQDILSDEWIETSMGLGEEGLVHGKSLNDDKASNL